LEPALAITPYSVPLATAPSRACTTNLTFAESVFSCTSNLTFVRKKPHLCDTTKLTFEHMKPHLRHNEPHFYEVKVLKIKEVGSLCWLVSWFNSLKKHTNKSQIG